jgi:5-methylcytosine-specific restriction enzyme A
MKRGGKPGSPASRAEALKRDERCCQHCGGVVDSDCEIDYLEFKRPPDDSVENLVTLCRRCWLLRDPHFRRADIGGALADGTLPSNWRDLVWEGKPALWKARQTTG